MFYSWYEKNSNEKNVNINILSSHMFQVPFQLATCFSLLVTKSWEVVEQPPQAGQPRNVSPLALTMPLVRYADGFIIARSSLYLKLGLQKLIIHFQI